MRFFIFPALPNQYDQRMVAGLAEGFRELGYQAVSFLSPLAEGTNTKNKINSSGDVIIEINKFRPEPGLISNNVRHVAWFQDVFIETIRDYGEFEKSSDIIYTLGDSELIGMNINFNCFLSSLVTGVGREIFNFTPSEMDYIADASLVGFIPHKPDQLFAPFNRTQEVFFKINSIISNFPYFRNSLSARLVINGFIKDYIPEFLKNKMLSVMSLNYQPLSGYLDINAAATDLREAVSSSYFDRNEITEKNALSSIKENAWKYVFLVPSDAKQHFTFTDSVNKFISWLVREYPRYLDRLVLAQLGSDLTDSFHIYGPGWERHPEYLSYWKGIAGSHKNLLEIYARSRINLANNTHGLGLHSRTLECMAAGGLLMMHTSPNESRPGGMRNSFEAGVHYIPYTRETFIEDASPWLLKNDKRTEIIRNARDMVRQEHLWVHRAAQILNDLNR